MTLNDRYTKHLVVSDSATVNPSQMPENVILVNSAGQKISTKTDAELNSRYAPLRNYPARFLKKLAAGTNVKVCVSGDSIYEGTTATTPGTDDAISLVCSHLSTTWGVTVTKANRSQSGRTAWQEKVEKWATMLADDADLYILGMTGKNDGAWDTGTQPRTGQERTSSLAMIESQVRELMIRKPNADVMIASGNPYGSASATSNTQQKKYSEGLARIAYSYGIAYADGWNATPRPVGYPDAADSAYLTDGVHPNSAGHALLAAAILANLPDDYDASDGQAVAFRSADLPGAGTTIPMYHSLGGTITKTTSETTAMTDRLITPSFTGTWSAGDSAPWTSSTANASTWFMAKCTDLFVDLKCGASQGVVDLILDGVVVANDLALSGLTDGKWVAIGLGMLPGVHHAEVRVVSGSVEIQGWGYNHAPSEYVPITSSRITKSGMGAASNLNRFYNIESLQSAVAGTVTFPFIGTGVLIEAYAADSASVGYYFTSITIDGAALTSPTWPAVDNDGASTVAISDLTGLTYGHHTLVVTFQATGFYLGGFSVLDERPTERPDSCEGVAKVGETVYFPKLWSELPTVTVTSTTANAAGASTITATSFLVTGTAGDVVRWRAVGRRAVT